MKTAIVYASVHHGNTKKLLDAISRQCEVDLVDATKIKEKRNGKECYLDPIRKKLIFADFFFDGFLADVFGQSKISDARQKVSDAIYQAKCQVLSWCF